MKKNITNIDKENLRQVIIDFPKQFEAGLGIAKGTKIKGNFNALEISGMGGSSLPANILRIFLNDLYMKNPKGNKRLAVYQNRYYSLPHEAYVNCLNFFASYSGNTEETVSSFREAIEHKLPSVCFATSGKIDELARKNNIPCVILPTGIQPRCATGYFFAAMLQVLINAKLIEDDSAKIIKLAGKLEKDILRLEEEGKQIANKLVGKTPVIYSSTKIKALAMIWKIKFNENSKIPAFYNFYPELNHNEMVGFTLPQGKFHIISLLDKKDHPQSIKRAEITAKILKKKGIDTTTIEMPDGDIFNTIFSTLVLGDWVSYYLALEYGQDPTPVDMVEDLKNALK